MKKTRRTHTWVGLLLGFLFFPLFSLAGTIQLAALTHVERADQAKQAVLSGNADVPTKNDKSSKIIRQALLIADERLEAGRVVLASDTLNDVKDLLPLSNDLLINALFNNRLGVIATKFQAFKEAKHYFKTSLIHAKKIKNQELSALLENDFANMFAKMEQFDEANQHFFLAEQHIIKTSNPVLKRTIKVNHINTLIKAKKIKGIHILNELYDQTKNSAKSEGNEKILLKIGALYIQAFGQFNLKTKYQDIVLSLHKKLLRVSEKTEDFWLWSSTLGQIGNFYVAIGKTEEAEQFYRKAAFKAQEKQLFGLLYQWQWRQAELLQRKGQFDQSLFTYRQAVDALAKISSELVKQSPDSYEKIVAPLYYQYADLLLRNTAIETDINKKRQQLLDLRELLEQLRVVEIEDYFNDQCALFEESSKNIDKLAGQSAIIYSIVLENRTELLVSYPRGIQQYTIPVNEKDLRIEIDNFRKNVQIFSRDNEFFGPSQKLYQWFIKPINQDLLEQGIDTLVFINDGILRTVPFAALHDGQQFLIEHFAIAVSPGLTLTNTAKTKFFGPDQAILINGLTEAVQGFDALPGVHQELKNIENLYANKTYKDKYFTLKTAEQEMSEGDYSVVHFATHAQFNSDHQKSFLITYDDKLTLNRLKNTIGLRKFKSKPLDLLVLSACQTAVGDDKAALGLAGVAISAGARSALATMWSVYDDSSSLLITNFYKNLGDHSLSKAQVLQKSQRSLLENKRFRHPVFWAPYLIIGNWL